MQGGLTPAFPSAVCDAKVQTTAYLYFAALLSAIGGFLFGYDTGVVSGALLQITEYFKLDIIWQQLIVSITIAGAWMFSVAAGKLNDKLGRKRTVIIASCLFTVGSGLMASAQDHWWLFFGRWIVGLGIGLSSMTVPLYIAEVSPAQYRGKLVTLNQLFITAGQFAAAVIDGLFSYDRVNGWRFMLGLAAIPAILQLVAFLWMPESPRWLSGKGRLNEAYSVLRQLRGKNADIEEEFRGIESCAKEVDTQNSFPASVMSKVWGNPELRKRLIFGVMLMVFQQIVAINTVMYYSASIIRMAGFRDQSMAIWLSAAVAFVNFAFSMVGVALVERLGRRVLTLSSLLGIFLSLTILSAGFLINSMNTPSVTFMEKNSSTCDAYTNCATCISNEDCAFKYNSKNQLAACVLKETNVTDALSLDWQLETELCPVLNNLKWLIVGALALYLAFFAPGMGPMPWTVNSELFPLWCRSTCFSIATSFNWFFNFLVSMTFLSITKALTLEGAFLMYAFFAVLAFIFCYFMQPETKGTSLEGLETKEKMSIARH